MSVIWTPGKSLITQPQGAVEIDWGHPATKGLLTFVTFSPSLWDHVLQAPPPVTILGAPEYNIATTEGVGTGVNSGGVSSDAMGCNSWAAQLFGLSGAFAVGFIPRSPFASDYVASMREAATGFRFYLKRFSSGTPGYGFAYSADAGTGPLGCWPDDSLGISALQWHSAAHQWFFNGVMYGSGGGVAQDPSSAALSAVSNILANGSYRHNGVYQFFAVWKEPLEMSVQERFGINPWSIFKPKPRTIFYADAVSGLTLTSITPTTGPSTGGTTVTMTGTGFEAGTVPKFNGVDATSVTIVSDTELTCVTPAL